MTRSRNRSPRFAGVRHVVLLLGVAIAAGCGGDSTAPGKVPDPVVPDRVEIVYALAPGGQFDSLDLFVVNPDGSSNRSLLALTGEESFPTWSPDGRTVLFQHREDGVLSLWRANEDGSNATRIPVNDPAPARWSPDGSWIIFAALISTGFADIAAVHPDGTGRHSLATGITGVMLSTPAWSSTGRIAFMRSAGTGGKGNIWAANVDGTGLTQLTTALQDQSPVWSPDGSLMAYTRFSLTQVGGQVTGQIVVVSANGSGPRVLAGADGSTLNVLPAWSPDGQWLLYQHRGVENGQTSCWFERIPVGGGTPIRIVPKTSGAECGGAAWRSRRPS
jgi:Tol biopolymer transport system component